jgi:hypothetical protein
MRRVRFRRLIARRRCFPCERARWNAATHNYKRHGIARALDAKTGRIIGQTHRRRPLKRVSSLPRCHRKQRAGGTDVHLIRDNYDTHKTELIRNWLAKRPRFHLHFTPTSASWLNLVERRFATLREKQMLRRVPCSTGELELVMHSYICQHNHDPKPLVCKKAEQILDSVARFCARTLETGH